MNCAGIQPGKLLLETSDDEWHAMHDVNLGGTFFGCREAARRMASVGSGVIINITSVCGYQRTSFARPLLGDQARRRRVNSVPGDGARTQRSAGRCRLARANRNPRLAGGAGSGSGAGRAIRQSFQTMMENGRKIIPLRRIGKPDDVARAVLFLREQPCIVRDCNDRVRGWRYDRVLSGTFETTDGSTMGEFRYIPVESGKMHSYVAVPKQPNGCGIVLGELGLGAQLGPPGGRGRLRRARLCGHRAEPVLAAHGRARRRSMISPGLTTS